MANPDVGVGGSGIIVPNKPQSIIKRLLRFGKQPLDVPAKTVQDLGDFQKQKDLLNRLITKGTVFSRDSLSKILADALATSYYRRSFYREAEACSTHPLVAGALELYVDSVCSVSGLTNRSVWCTSEDPKIENTVNQFLEEVYIEERIRDWAGQLGLFGDFFVEGIGREGIGIAYVDDNFHPADMERIDINGRLEGFIRTGQFTSQAQYTAEMDAPWKYCLVGSTKISLLDGTNPTLKDMADSRDAYVGKYVLSVNPKTLELEPDKIIEVKKTRLNAELVRVHLDNGRFVDCTPDHRFMLRDGSYKEAQALSAGESLMPLYMKMTSSQFSYACGYNPADMAYHVLHRVVAKSKYGKEKIERGLIVHHKDYNKLNNDPSNLELMPQSEHAELHGNHMQHESDCSCAICKTKRHETCGENHPNYSERVTKLCACGCGKQFTTKTTGVRGNRKFIQGHWAKANRGKLGSSYHNQETCACAVCRASRHEKSDRYGWNGVVSKVCPICLTQFDKIRVTDFANHVRACTAILREVQQSSLVNQILNHKVIQVERLSVREDTYDLMTEKNHNFPLEAGVFVHNSHFRVFGVTKKVLNTALGIFGEPGRMFSLEQSKMQDRKFRITTRYGVSLLTSAIPIYKRLKMCEDSLLMSRMTRGILWYLYKIKVSGGNMDSAAELVQGYAEYLKRSLATGLDTDTGQQQWRDKWAPVFGQVEDLFVPESDDVSVTVERLGGEPDIKAIVDVDLLTNQLLGSLRVSKSMLGITDDLPGSIGEGAANRISINFAKNAQRLQAGLRQGIKRLAQVHLAFRNLNPDPTRFEINFAEISSAEEEEIKNALDKGVDIVDRAMEMVVAAAGEGQIDKLELLDYFNRKVLKLNDLDLEAMRINVLEAKAIASDDGMRDTIKKLVEVAKAKQKLNKPKAKLIAVESDLFSYLPEVDKDKTKLDENLQVLVDAPSDTLNEEQLKIKNEILAVKPAKLFRVDEDLVVKEERASWRPTIVHVDTSKGPDGK